MFKQYPKQICFFIPSAIIGGASVVGGAIDAVSNSAMQKRAIAAQKAENQKNREYAVQMYKEFESPQAQVQQLAAAGINPYSNGAVSTNSVGSASTSSLPTPPPSTFGSSIAEGVQNAVQSYTQRKQFQQQLDADALNQTRNFLLELSKLKLDEHQLKTQIDLWNEQISASKTSRKYQQLINQELEDFLNSGNNRLTDAHNESVARVDKLYSDISSDESRLQLDWSRYLTEKQLTLETIKQLSRNNELADQVKTNYNIDYNALPDYLKTMLSGIILLEKKSSTTMFETVGDKKKFNDFLDQLKSDFETYYLAYLKNSSDVTATQAGNHLTTQNILSALALLK